MAISLPQAGAKKIVSRIRRTLDENGCSVGDLHSLLVTLGVVRLATVLAALRYRSLQHLPSRMGLAALHYRGPQYLLPRPGRRRGFPVREQLGFSETFKVDFTWRAVNFPSHTSTSLTSRPTTLWVWTDAAGRVGWG